MIEIPIKCRSTFMLCIASISLAGCVVFGASDVEEAAHSVLLSEGNFELREYTPVVVAETVVDANFKEAGNTAFRRLFNYISGENVSAEKISMTTPVLADTDSDGERIEMTAPVLGEQSASGWTYSFVLPSSYSLESAPKPLNPAVELARLPKKSVAVIKFSGRQNESLMKSKQVELEQWLDNKKLNSISTPRWAGYNPPFTLPWFRRNEVMIDVEQHNLK